MAKARDPYQLLDEALGQISAGPAAPFLTWGYLDTEDVDMNLVQSQVRLVDKAIGDIVFTRKSAIDIGCGRGGTCHYLATKHKPRSVLGVDLSAANVSACQRQFKSHRLRFQLADATNLPQRDQSFDIALNIESSGAYNELNQFFCHCARILRLGGVLIYADVIPSALKPSIEEALTTIGFTLSRNESLREGVLRARAQLGQRSFDAIKPKLDASLSQKEREDMHNYFALPGSKMYEGLESGALDYIVIHAVKKKANAAPSQTLAAVTQKLKARDALLKNILSGQRDPVFAFGQPNADASCHVFALSYGGGGASVYRSWAQSKGWPKDYAFCALQLPGRENRLNEEPLTDMEDCLDHLIAAIAPFTAKPWALIGCSLGCKIAFELARHFEGQGQPPIFMLLMACPAPSIPVAYPAEDGDSEDIAHRVHHLGGTPLRIIDNPAALKVFAKALNGDLKLAQSYLLPSPAAAAPADNEAARPRYRPGKLTVAAKTLLVYAGDDHLVSEVQIKAWRQHLSGELTLKRVMGGHFFLRELRPQLEAGLIAALKKALMPAAAKDYRQRFPYSDPREAQTNETVVLCFHHAGAHAGFWRPWLTIAKDHQLHLCPYELPGHSTRLREDCLETITAVLADIAPIMASFKGKPLALFGHSLGALIAFALAESLPARQLAGLFVSGRLPPQQKPPAPLRHRMNDTELAKELSHLGGTPKEVLASAKLLAMVLPILRADFAITETYALHPKRQHQPRPLPLTVLGGQDDAEVSPSELEGWLKWADDASTCHMFPGDHFYLQGREEPILALISKTIARRAMLKPAD